MNSKARVLVSRSFAKSLIDSEEPYAPGAVPVVAPRSWLSCLGSRAVNSPELRDCSPIAPANTRPMTPVLHVLYAEDNPIDADLTRTYFARYARDFGLQIVHRAEEFL